MAASERSPRKSSCSSSHPRRFNKKAEIPLGLRWTVAADAVNNLIIETPLSFVRRHICMPSTRNSILLAVGLLLLSVATVAAVTIGKRWYVADDNAAPDVQPSKLASSKGSGEQSPQPPRLSSDRMVWIPGGEFMMGSDDNEPVEAPAHRVRVDGFWMDETEVTNAQFDRFVEATGYVTTAERAPDWEELKKQVPPGTPKPPDDQLVPASMVFTPPDRSVSLDDFSAWWSWVPGANWRHPRGPKSSIDGMDNHPVVQVSWDDAVAYCKWIGKRLPTEAEWEFAARGGLKGKPFVWGDEPVSDKHPQANIWQGHFPEKNTKADGYALTAPVKSFKPNGYGLYDMAGNVWEWCSDWYRVDAYPVLLSQSESDVLDNPHGPSESFDPSNRYESKRVHRGGSFLCSDSYCSSYRPSARRGTTPDTSMSHLGFRCVRLPAESP
jgi:formylglycine-generating enzyme required for sulfatase activity